MDGGTRGLTQSSFLSFGLFAVIVFSLVLAACGSDSTSTTEPAGESGGSVDLECAVKGYPCSLAEVPLEILERTDALGEEALAMIEGGASTAEAAAWLDDQADLAEVQWDDLAVRFRLDGGRELWLLTQGALGTRGAPGSESPADAAAHQSVPLLGDVVGGESEQKKALVLSPMLFDFGSTDEGAAVAEILKGTRGYEGGVSYEANATAVETEVGLADFTGWRGYDVVHVSTHGARVCDDEGSCWASIAISTLDPLLPAGPGTKAEKVKATFGGMGLAWSKAEGSEIDLLFATADYFRAQYGGGLDETLIFINGCETIGGGGNDIVDALKGTSSVYVGWNQTVQSSAAAAAAVGLYKELSDGGYPAEIALENIGSSASAGSAQLILGERSDDGDLRIREVVTVLNPATGLELTPADNVAIEGTTGDGEPDAAPYLVRVDGVKEEFAADMVVHVEVDGIAAEPTTLSDGDRNENDQWTVSGVVPLGYDLEDDRDVTFRAWTELHSGGESDHETEATLTGEEPIMGYEWVMVSTNRVHNQSMERVNESTAELVLEFEEGQDFNEPHPRYVVTGGTVTYGDRSSSALGCTYSGGGLTFEVTPEMSPPVMEKPFAPSVLIFDTTVTPVEYHGVIFTQGPDDTVTQDCTAIDPNTYSVNVVSHGGNTSWMSVVPSDHFTVIDRSLIEGAQEPASGYTIQFTLTRTK